MQRSEGVNAAEVTRLKERLAKIEELVRSTQLEFSEVVTVHNKSGQSLHLTLSITENTHPPEPHSLSLNSIVQIPNNSTVSHHLTRNGKHYFSTDYDGTFCSSAAHNNDNAHQLESRRENSKSPQRHEQKFQSISSRKEQNNTQGETNNNAHKGEIKIEEEDVSDIEEETKPRPFTDSEPQNKQETPNNNFASIPSYAKHQQGSHEMQLSPQVFSYLHQQYRKQQPEINTSFKKQANQSAQLQTPSKNKYALDGHRLSNVQAKSRDPSSAKILNAQLAQQKEKSSREDPRSSSKSKPESKQILTHRTKAEQLFKERQQKHSNTASNKKTNTNHSNNVKQRFNRFVTASRDRSQHSLSKRSVSPKIEAITERVSSRQKSPCGHYRIRNESHERQRFLLLVEQNPLVSKHLCSEEREELFQKLRNDTDSVSLWPMKLVNYTNAKIKKSLSLNYAVLNQ